MNKVAVIMSIYFHDKFSNLKTAVNSILSQTYQYVDLYIYIDGNISVINQEYIDLLSKNDRVFIFKSTENHGLASALNCLISHVIDDGNYAFIARMDADDISRNDRILRQVEYLNMNPDIDVCGTSCREFGASFALEEKHLPITHQELLDFSIVRCPFIHPSVMFRRRVFETGIRYPTDTALTEDMALWFELLVSGFKFANINEVLLDYRLNENTIKRRKGMDKALSEVKIRLYYMFKLKRISFKSILLILSRFAFHLLPDSIMKYAYKNVR